MTKDTQDFSQFTESVACRESILPIDEDTSEPKGCIRRNKIGPVLEVTTCRLQGKKTVLRSELCLLTKTLLTHGSEFLMT